jgi:arginase
MTKRSEPVSLIGLPYLMGTRALNDGYHMAHGPRVLLSQEQVPALVEDVFKDVSVTMIEDADEPTEKNTGGDYRLLPIGDQMSRILVQNIRLAEEVSSARKSGRTVVAMVGACSASLGMIGGLEDATGPIGMIWLDAHGDAQTPDTSENGFIEGMPVTTIAGKCWPKYRRKIPGFREIPEENIITIGLSEMFSSTARESAGEAVGRLVHKPVIEKDGFETAICEAFDDLRTRVEQVYIHFDTDVIDPSEARCNSHAADGGLSADQVKRIFQLAAERFEILAVAVASFDPNVDPRAPSVLSPIIAHAVACSADSRAK